MAWTYIEIRHRLSRVNDTGYHLHDLVRCYTVTHASEQKSGEGLDSKLGRCYFCAYSEVRALRLDLVVSANSLCLCDTLERPAPNGA